MHWLPCGCQTITPCCGFVPLFFIKHQNVVFQRSLTLYLKLDNKGAASATLYHLSCLSLVPLLVNLLFGVWRFFMRLHAGRARECLSADGTRTQRVKMPRERLKFICAHFLFPHPKPSLFYLTIWWKTLRLVNSPSSYHHYLGLGLSLKSEEHREHENFFLFDMSKEWQTTCVLTVLLSFFPCPLKLYIARRL